MNVKARGGDGPGEAVGAVVHPTRTNTAENRRSPKRRSEVGNEIEVPGLSLPAGGKEQRRPSPIAVGEVR
jgi:hypothetical protein